MSASVPYAVTKLVGDVVATEELKGGLINLTRRITTSGGKTYILKQPKGIRPGMYSGEADGLNALAHPDCPCVPDVISWDEDHILLEDFGPKREPADGYWIEFGRAVARLHSHTAPAYGYHRDNYLGDIPVRNPWTESGHEFFASYRVLHWLEISRCSDLLTPEDVKAVEALCRRLPELVPKQGPSLLHGDLWAGNMLVAPNGGPGLIDPAVYYGWPEAELSMTFQYEGVPPGFLDAYRELNPLEPGYQERLELLNIRDLLGMLAHFGDSYGSLALLRALLAKFG